MGKGQNSYLKTDKEGAPKKLVSKSHRIESKPENFGLRKKERKKRERKLR